MQDAEAKGATPHTEDMHVCATVDGGEPKCYRVPPVVQKKIIEARQTHGDKPVYRNSEECLSDTCGSENAWKFSERASSNERNTMADIDCFSAVPGAFSCVTRDPASAGMIGAAVASKPARDVARPMFNVRPDSKEDTSTSKQLQALAQQQKYRLLGQSVKNSSERVTAGNTQLLASNAWGSPFEGGAQLLGDGSALIAQDPGTASRLLTTASANRAQSLALEARNAPVVGALDWLKQGTPLGYVDSQNPATTWTVGNELASRFPQAVLAGPQQQDATLSEALYTVQNSPNNMQKNSLAAHFCCQGRRRGCELQTVERGTPGCYPIHGADMLGAAEGKCLMNCTGELFQELRPDAVCFEHGDCQAKRRWEVGSLASCYASQDVCRVATAQSKAMDTIGSTYA